MKHTLLKNAIIVTGKYCAKGSLLIQDNIISKIWLEKDGNNTIVLPHTIDEEIDLKGHYLFAGGIDAHVHFREPGLTHKANIQLEATAALKGGITYFFDMPNTNPVTTSLQRINEKKHIASIYSPIHYGFNLGATNNNIAEIEECIKNNADFGAVKVFMGASTGDMLVDDNNTLNKIFQITNKPIFIHSEDELIIRQNLAKAKEKFGDNIPFGMHSLIRSHKACIKSTQKAIDAAIKYGTHLHILHISTKEEVELIKQAKTISPNISCETSANYLWFSSKDYDRLGAKIKCNPAIKDEQDKLGLIQGIKDGVIDTIGSDHAPHLIEEKEKPYINCPSGIPSIEQSFIAMLTIADKYNIPITQIARVMSENIANIMNLKQYGKIEEGYIADLVAFKKEKFTLKEVSYKCKWSPYIGEDFLYKVKNVWVGGKQLI